MRKKLIIGIVLGIAVIIIIAFFMLGGDDNSGTTPITNDYLYNVEDYLLSDSEIESAGFKISKQIMRGSQMIPSHDAIGEATLQIYFSDSNIENGYDLLHQRVRIFPNSDKALDHFEMRKKEEENWNFHSDYESTEFLNTFGDKSYAFYRLYKASSTQSSVQIIFVKNNIYVEFASHVNDDDYHKKILNLGTITEDKI